MSLVLKNLYIGNLSDANSCEFIQKNNINLIINCCAQCNVYVCKGGITVYHINYYDDERQNLFLNGALVSILKIIDNHLLNNLGGVLVHCYAGVSRSVSVVIAYLIWKYNMSYNDALNYIRSSRPIANPNPGFAIQLINFSRLKNINIL